MNTTGFFQSQIQKAGIPMRPSSDFADVLAAPSAAEIDELAERSENLEQRIISLNDSYETLKKREVELTEWRWVLREAGGFFDRVCCCSALCRLFLLTWSWSSGAWPSRGDPDFLRQRRGPAPQ